MYTEEDIENLAEYIFIAFNHVEWEYKVILKTTWKELNDVTKARYKAAAKVALEFKLAH